VPESRYTFLAWWRLAEERAEVKRVSGRGYHSLRRKFATEMKHAPLKDLCHLGGWKSATTVVSVYQQPDADTQRSAFAARRPIASSG
jgi:hypothetical protein